MGCELNLDSISALEEQIREHEKAIIRLKRARNSLLDVSKLPPEVLGKIFHWNATLNGKFGGLDKKSHNFLLVCHHWFEVASQTPDLWGFWGNTLEDWGRRHRRSGTALLDLVLKGDRYGDRRLNTTLRNVLQERAIRDTVRRVHLTADLPELLSSIISQLTPNREELRSNSMESFILLNWGGTPVDVSDFFVYYRFPKLRRLHLSYCTTSSPSWDYLASRTSVLTTLALDLILPTPAPTTPQLLSILASNPTLQKVVLIRRAVPDDGGGSSSFRVQLHHLNKLHLQGGLQHILRLLHQLDYPRNMKKLTLELHNCDVADISQIIGPYLRDHLQHHDRPRKGLNLYVSSSYSTRGSSIVILRVGDAGGINFSSPGHIDVLAEIIIHLKRIPDEDGLGRATFDFITHVPQEEVVYLETCNDLIAMENASTQFPNLRALSLNMASLSVDGGDWSPLINLLVHRMSFGNRLDTLVIANSRMRPEMEEGIRGMVRELVISP